MRMRKGTASGRAGRMVLPVAEGLLHFLIGHLIQPSLPLLGQSVHHFFLYKVSFNAPMDLEAMSNALRSKVGNLLTDADSLRKIIVQEVPEIQNPVQNVRFSTVANQLHLMIQGLGQQSETERL
ncbi:Hypothetical predicted protein [Olea europaea subsp. europaea]|uniref:Uncharacterized protein n=1 Tax=Olea europaea subsp. europaea TaxID=158383 RepID=A0A8S0V0W3_OLEEU|nr:Hypothetical predicted protein [Olea europaea subsp. europaea]